jgi:outer membrane protein assembly factor BamB
VLLAVGSASRRRHRRRHRSSRSRRRSWLPWAGAILLAGAFGGGIALYQFQKAPGNISHPDVDFEATRPPETPKRTKQPEVITWSRFGRTFERTRSFVEAARAVRPPFKERWRFRGKVLLEFPPSLDRTSLYQLDDDAVLRAFDKRTGRIRWKRKLGALAASAPAVGMGRVFVTVLLTSRSSGHGRVVALDARTGRTLWRKELPSRTESSPLLASRRLFFGSENGTVYGVRAISGRTLWTYRATGAVKGAIALDQGKLYFGDYGGQVHAIRSRNGRRVWSTGTNGGRFGRSGRFYSGAAVAYGRVYLGNTDGRAYSFSQRTGRLAWATRTGSYVYASPAVANVPGRGPTVFQGSYDGRFYAFDARSGRIRWSYGGNGKISGSATVVGNIVYFARLRGRDTIGLDTRTGRRVYFYPRGGFDPVISDGRWLFITGYRTLHGMEPLALRRTSSAKARAKARARARARAKAKAKAKAKR